MFGSQHQSGVGDQAQDRGPADLQILQPDVPADPRWQGN